MSTTTKATVRNGRAGKHGVFSANHNFSEQTRAVQSHIDSERTSDNVYGRFNDAGKWTWSHDGFDARAYELGRYTQIFGEGIKAQNDRHERSRHHDRVKSVEDVYTNKKTAPMETILQVGNSHSEMTTEEQAQYLRRALGALTSDLGRYGENLIIHDCALHMDETVPHVHLRYSFAVRDREGHLVPNQSKALEAMGFTPPEQGTRTRYNNALVSFSDWLREAFYGHVERQGLTVDREVKSPSERHVDRLGSRAIAKAKEVGELEKLVAQLNETARGRQQELAGVLQQVQHLQQYLGELSRYSRELDEYCIQANEVLHNLQDLGHGSRDVYQWMEDKVNNITGKTLFESYCDDNNLDYEVFVGRLGLQQNPDRRGGITQTQ